MPTIVTINGVTIAMYFQDHHVHVIDGDDRATVDIATGAVMAGRLSHRARKVALPWIEANANLLLAKWNELQIV